MLLEDGAIYFFTRLPPGGMTNVNTDSFDRGDRLLSRVRLSVEWRVVSFLWLSPSGQEIGVEVVERVWETGTVK